jgi:hypothetical protein
MALHPSAVLVDCRWIITLCRSQTSDGACGKGQLSSFGMGGSQRGGAAREPPHNIDQLAVCGAGGILELIGRVLVSEPAKAPQLAHPLSPIY